MPFPDTTPKAQALDEIAALVTTHSISIDEIAARVRQEKPSVTGQVNTLKKLLSYIGGIFVFGGLIALFSMIWDDMSSAQRVLVTFGIGLVAFILGILSVKDQRMSAAATPLFLISAVLQPSGMMIFLAEYFPHGNDPQLATILIILVMLIQFSAAFWTLRRTSLAFLSTAFWGFLLLDVIDWLGADNEYSGIAFGLSILCIAYSTEKTVHRSITPFWYFVGSGAFLASAFDFLNDTPIEILYLGINAFFVYLSISLASRTILFTSVIGLLCYISYFIFHYFKDVLGGPIAIVIIGLVMIGLSSYAVKLGQKIKR